MRGRLCLRNPAKALPQLPILQRISPWNLFHLGTMVLLEPCPKLFLENQQLNFNHAKPKLLVTRGPQDARTWGPENHLNHECALSAILLPDPANHLCLGNHLTLFHGSDPANSTLSWALYRKDKASLCKPVAIHICLPGHNSDERRRTKSLKWLMTPLRLQPILLKLWVNIKAPGPKKSKADGKSPDLTFKIVHLWGTKWQHLWSNLPAR